METALLLLMPNLNFHIFPIAFGIIDSENDAAWKYFLEYLNRLFQIDGV